MASGDAIESIEMESALSAGGSSSTSAVAVGGSIPKLPLHLHHHQQPSPGPFRQPAHRLTASSSHNRITSSDDDDRDRTSEDRAASLDTNGDSLTVAGKDAANIGHYKYQDNERKLGHRRIGESGQVTYKKIETTQLMGSIQLGIQYSVGSLASKPKRDLLMKDFFEQEAISFPPEGSTQAPAHHYSEFKFKIYAPTAFRYFRNLFGIQPDDFMMSMCSAPLRELSNPGASGSIFYLTGDDEFIIKTVQHKEGEFLQKLLPGYYLNLSQNPRTLLPKFFGLYCFQCNSKNIRLIVMNNLLPSYVKMHLKYDLKGSTYNRKASKSERSKKSPTYKDLDFMEQHPDGILLEADTYNALVKTINRDCRVLESFKIMDYSLLVGVHNLDLALQEKKAERENAPAASAAAAAGAPGQPATDDEYDLEDAPEADQFIAHERDREERERGATALNRSRSINRQRLVAHSTAMESIQAESEPIDEEEDVPPGGIPARSHKGERLLLFIGIIDILQSYRLKKRLEHTFKSIIHDGDTVSVCRPSFYAQRFQTFMAKTVFKKIPSPTAGASTALAQHQHHHHAHSYSHQAAGGNNNASGNTPIRRGSGAAGAASMSSGLGTSAGPSAKPQSGSAPSCSSTPPPPFDDISEGTNSINRHQTLMQQYPTLSRRIYSNREDTVSISEIRLDPHLAIDTSVHSNFSSGHLSSWTPPASVEGSTPTFTEGTPSFTESSSSGEMAFSGNSSPLNTSASAADHRRHQPSVEDALNSLTSEMTVINNYSTIPATPTTTGPSATAAGEAPVERPPQAGSGAAAAAPGNNASTGKPASRSPFRFTSKIFWWQPADN